MDFMSLLKSNKSATIESSTISTSDTMATDNASAKKLMENLLPMLGGQFSPFLRMFVSLQHLFGSYLGVDATILLSAICALWAFNKIGRQVYMSGYTFMHAHFMSSIGISSADDIYPVLMRWLAHQPRMAKSRNLMAETVSKSAWEEEEEVSEINTMKILGDNGVEGEFLNFSNQEAKSPPRYVPALGLHTFRWNGKYFRLHRKQQSLFDESSGLGTFKDKEDLVIYCLGRSPDPIKALLRYVKESHYHAGQFAKTTIKRPAPQSMRRWGGRYNWSQVAVRPVRPMRTVVLDPRSKAQVLADMNEYLHPATPRWYANRGIPLRRGYLFYGPPGTGKTSLSFALAGVFGLDIYVISLLEPSLSEEDLGNLFNSLPRRCVVLLEDIDSAGLRRPDDNNETDDNSSNKTTNKDDADNKSKDKDSSDSNSKKESDDKTNEGDSKSRRKGGKEDWKVSDLAKALKDGKSDDKKTISLSGLLNAIDGVASHEGRVLIMTTNKPESLDEALIRPGRVDLQVGFTNATRSQARQLFQRMYEVDNPAEWSSRRLVRAPSNLKTKCVEEPALELAGSKPTTKNPILNELPTPPGTPNPLLPRGPAASPSLKAVEGDESDKEPGVEATVEESGEVEVEAVEDEGQCEEEFDLSKVAASFAAKIPDEMFSPAEIQGFLLKRKKDPLQALRDADTWAEALAKQKESKTKVLTVQ